MPGTLARTEIIAKWRLTTHRRAVFSQTKAVHIAFTRLSSRKHLLSWMLRGRQLPRLASRGPIEAVSKTSAGQRYEHDQLASRPGVTMDRRRIANEGHGKRAVHRPHPTPATAEAIARVGVPIRGPRFRTVSYSQYAAMMVR